MWGYRLSGGYKKARLDKYQPGIRANISYIKICEITFMAALTRYMGEAFFDN